jgi:hypothetical protein
MRGTVGRGMVDLITSQRLAGTFEAHHAPTTREVGSLTAQGVPTDALADLRAGYVVFDELGFEFEHHIDGMEGVRALLFLITDGQGVARDVVAWTPHDGRLATWLNRAWALGEEKVFAPRLSPQDELPVWRTPLGWLRANCKGLCLVRPQAAAHYLDCAGPLLAEDVPHGAELKRLLTRPAPRILVPSLSHSKAA